jgi:hypothetical protein
MILFLKLQTIYATYYNQLILNANSKILKYYGSILRVSYYRSTGVGHTKRKVQPLGSFCTTSILWRCLILYTFAG